MAGINVDLDFFDSREIKRLTALLGRGAAELVLRLECYAGKFHAETGEFPGYSVAEIEAIAGWAGEAGAMIAALTKDGLFLEPITAGTAGTADGFRIIGWLDRQGHIAAFKAQGRARAKARWSKAAGKPHAMQDALQPAMQTAMHAALQPALHDSSSLHNSQHAHSIKKSAADQTRERLLREKGGQNVRYDTG